MMILQNHIPCWNLSERKENSCSKKLKELKKKERGYEQTVASKEEKTMSNKHR